MLATVASVALAAPAFAWDFKASGSAAGRLNITNTKAYKTAVTTVTSGGVTSEGSSLKLSSSNTDGPNTVSFSYTVDWDGDLDETLAVSGSSKVGDWTASGSVSYDTRTLGCYASSQADNGTATTSSACAAKQTGEDTTSVTLTDGTMTIILGEAAHLSTQNVSSGGAAGGSIVFSASTTGAAGMDTAPGAMVDSFHGASLGYAINDTTTATFAYQKSSDAGDLMGLGAYMDGEVASAAQGGYSTTGTGLGVSTVAGPASIGFTFASASTANTGSATTAADKKSTSMSTMGLGVTIDLGDIKPFISYGTFSSEGSLSKNKWDISGSEIGLTYALGADTIVVYVGNSEEKYTANAVESKPYKKSGMELGYNTTVGPAGLAIGYGSKNKNMADNAALDGYAMTDIEVALTYSF
jgi:predicted porin